MDDRLCQNMKKRKNKDENPISQLLLIHNTCKLKPTFPINETCSSHVQNESKNESQMGSKMTIEVQN
jgi:hypothetical protein